MRQVGSTLRVLDYSGFEERATGMVNCTSPKFTEAVVIQPSYHSFTSKNASTIVRCLGYDRPP